MFQGSCVARVTKANDPVGTGCLGLSSVVGDDQGQMWIRWERCAGDPGVPALYSLPSNRNRYQAQTDINKQGKPTQGAGIVTATL